VVDAFRRPGSVRRAGAGPRRSRLCDLRHREPLIVCHRRVALVSGARAWRRAAGRHRRSCSDRSAAARETDRLPRHRHD
jgi:hypothetical protein